MRHLFVPALALLVTSARPAFAEQVYRLSVDEAVERALERGRELAESRAQIEAARAAHASARALYGPRVVVDAKAFYFNRRPTFDLEFGSAEGSPVWLRQAIDQLIPSPMESGEQYTADFRVAVVQPLTKLEAIRELDEVRRIDVEVAEVQADKTKVELAYQAREAAYLLLKVRDLASMLAETEAEVLAREAQVKAFRAAELVGPEQVLEVGVRLAEVRQQMIKVRALESVAASRLRMVLQIEEGATIEVDLPQDPPPPPDLAGCVAAARRARAELAEVRLRAEQAETGVRAKIQEYVPDISLVASYQYQAGTAVGQPELAVGAVMSWTPFAWGETYHAVREAKATARRARLASERVEELIGLDVERAHAEATAAFESITVAEAARGQAEELYRIEQARFDVRDNTATDLLAAQTSLLRAETTVRSARFDYLVALAELRRTMGEP